MYSFELNKNQINLKKNTNEFCKKYIYPKVFELDKKETTSQDLITKLYENKYFGLQISSIYNGCNLDTLSYILVIEELAKYSSSQASTIAAHNSLAVAAISKYGSLQQKKQLFKYFLPNTKNKTNTNKTDNTHHTSPNHDHHKAIKCLWAFALTESHCGSDIKNIHTTAKFDKNSQCFILNGAKQWITNCANPHNQGITVLAKTSSDNSDNFDSYSLFLVDANTKGLYQTAINDKLMWRSGFTGELKFHNITLSKNNLLGAMHKGLSNALAVLDNGRLSIAATGLGLAKGAYNIAFDYAQKRRCFGKAIINHQAIAFKLADMYTKIKACENLVYQACWMKDQNKPFGEYSSMAKLYSSEVAELCARDGLQILGSKALKHGNLMEKYYRDATILRIGEGTSEIQRKIIARQLKKLD